MVGTSTWGIWHSGVQTQQTLKPMQPATAMRARVPNLAVVVAVVAALERWCGIIFGNREIPPC